MMLSIGTVESGSVIMVSDAGKREECRGGRGQKSVVMGSCSGKVLVRVTERDRSCVGRYGEGGGGARFCIDETYAMGGVVTWEGIGGVDRGLSFLTLVPKDDAAGDVGLDDRLTGDGALGTATGISNLGC